MLVIITKELEENMMLTILQFLIVIGSFFALVYFIFKGTKLGKNLTMLEKISLVEPGPERIHYSKLYKSKYGEVLSYLKEDVRTAYNAFLQGARLSNNGKCLGWREKTSGAYVWQSYDDTITRATNFGSGLIALDLPPGQDSILGIYLKNCPEWIMSELAAFMYSMVIVALYDTLGVESSSYIMNQTQMKVVVCENDEKAVNILNVKSPYLKTLITLKEVSMSTYKTAKAQGVDIYTFKEVEEKGSRERRPHVPPKPEDLATICYTSGTTGLPKGAMLTHSNEISSGDSVYLNGGKNWVTKNDIMLSFLPLAHLLERFIQHMVFKEGGAVGFFSGDLQKLNEDIVALKPTVMVSVPRVLNKIYDKTMKSVSNSMLKHTLFKLAFYAKMDYLKRGLIRTDTIWDKLVFQKAQESMGGRLRLILTSSAPTTENVLDFMRCVIGCQVIEGYGQTECYVISTTLCGDTIPGHVGAPGACCKVKLVDVPEMDYYAEQDVGEVCVKGMNVFKGYYKDADKTKEVIDKDGWLHTGDIGQWLSNGALKLVDRKKNIFKLSQGEYIAPEKIENIYLRSSYVDQVVIYGESLKSCVVAIVVMNKEAVTDWLTKTDIGGCLDFDDRIKRMILEDMQKHGRESGLPSFQQVKDIYLHPELFSAENGLLTVTLKIKRQEVYKKFQHQINKIYKNFN